MTGLILPERRFQDITGNCPVALFSGEITHQRKGESERPDAVEVSG
jgi:hypothetical protein